MANRSVYTMHFPGGGASLRATSMCLMLLALAIAGAGCGSEHHEGILTDIPGNPALGDAQEDSEGGASEPADLDPLRLDGQGRITYDVDGIPHVSAVTDADAFFLQGWATASQRMAQMDLARRRARGTRAEVLGEEYLRTDLLARALRFAEWGARTEQALASDDAEILHYFQAYAAGVNAWLSAAKQGREGASLPPQFGALGYTPEPWTVGDSLAIEKMIAAGLSMRPDMDITLGLVDALLGPELFSDLYRYAAFDREYVVPDFFAAAEPDDESSAFGPLVSSARHDLRQQARLAAQARFSTLTSDELASAIQATRHLRLSEGGSNNWVVSGKHTTSGAPIIAGDSHQGVAHPAVYYYVHLDAMSLPDATGTINVIGASFPGIPFIVFGHNGTAAFMPTTSILDASDAYLETFDAEAQTVQFEGKAVPVEAREEQILVRPANGAIADATSKTYTLYGVPHHGPMLPTEALGLPIPLSVSIRWTGYRPQSLGRAFFEINRATSFDELRAALEHMHAGGTHWVYADIHGDIGYSSRVDLPRREIVDPETPPVKTLPGEGGYEWLQDDGGITSLALVPSEWIPWVKNPERGFVNTANNDPVGQTDDGNPFDAAVYLSGVFDIGTRAFRPRLRIEHAIAEQGLLGLDDVAAIQLDDLSRLGERLSKFIPNAAKHRPDLMDDRLWAAMEVLLAWDFRCGVDSRGAVLFHGWLAVFARAILADEAGGLLGNILLDDLDSRAGLVVVKFLAHWLEATAPDIEAIEAGTMPFPSASGTNFFDDQSTQGVVETRDEMILRALTQALDELEPIFQDRVEAGEEPANPANWRWGRWHLMQLLDLAEPWLPGASSAALPKAGCLYTVDVADFDWLVDGKLPSTLVVDNAASDRFVLEMAPQGVIGRAILPGGQDERPQSAHHNDQLDDFLQGRLRPLRFLAEEIQAGSEATVELDAGYPVSP